MSISKEKKVKKRTAALDETRFLVGSAKVVNFSPQRGSLLVGATPLGHGTLEAEPAVKNIDSPHSRRQEAKFLGLLGVMVKARWS